MSSPHCHLLSLPAELLMVITGFLRKPALTKLARTCRVLNYFAECQLYRSIRPWNFDKQLPLLLHGFDSDPMRLDFVRSMQLYFSSVAFNSWQIARPHRQALHKYLPLMSGLKELFIESPFWNESHDGTQPQLPGEWVNNDLVELRAAFEQASFLTPAQSPRMGFENLVSLALRTHGDRDVTWEIGGFQCLFLLPSLRQLYLACVIIPGPLPKLQPFRWATPLECLGFEECDISPEGLFDILATPAALKILFIGENIHHKDYLALKPALGETTESIEATMKALQLVAHSLVSLKHLDSLYYQAHPGPEKAIGTLPGHGFRDFHALKQIRCNPTSFIYEYTSQSPLLAPPTLEEIIFYGYNHGRENKCRLLDQLPALYPLIKLPYLKEVHLVQPMNIFDERIPPHFPVPHVQLKGYAAAASAVLWHPPRARQFYLWARQLWIQRRVPVVLRVAHHRDDVAPPHLYLNRVPGIADVFHPELDNFPGPGHSDDEDSGMEMMDLDDVDWEGIDDPITPASEHLTDEDIREFAQRTTERLIGGVYRADREHLEELGVHEDQE